MATVVKDTKKRNKLEKEKGREKGRRNSKWRGAEHGVMEELGKA